jgi:hypothetical protein
VTTIETFVQQRGDHHAHRCIAVPSDHDLEGASNR